MPDITSPSPAGDVAFLVHHDGDDVAVAVHDTEPGTAVAAYLVTSERFEIEVREAIPLGHKVALRDLTQDGDVTEYNVRIGLARLPIARGSLVHTHNLRSARWRSSV
jgi:(2R)-sulfolactate sulfo-lyase subunit alpha